MLTWYEFEQIVKGFNRKQDKDWLHTRMIATMIANKFSNRRIMPQDLLKLDIDNENHDAPLVTLEQFNKMKNAWSKN